MIHLTCIFSYPADRANLYVTPVAAVRSSGNAAAQLSQKWNRRVLPLLQLQRERREGEELIENRLLLVELTRSGGNERRSE